LHCYSGPPGVRTKSVASGSIDFYGYGGLNLEQIKAALPVRVGDLFPDSFELIEEINKAVTSVIGRRGL